jgi:predicted transcriptional regulator
MQLNGALQHNRKEQELLLFEQLLQDFLQQQFFTNADKIADYERLKQELSQGKLLAYEALSALFI